MINDQIYLIKISDLEDAYGGFIGKTTEYLKRASILYVGDLAIKSQEELLAIKGIGEVKLFELQRALNDLGVQIGEQK